MNLLALTNFLSPEGFSVPVSVDMIFAGYIKELGNVASEMKSISNADDYFEAVKAEFFNRRPDLA